MPNLPLPPPAPLRPRPTSRPTPAVIRLDEDADLRVTTRLTGVEPGSVRIGMPVQVTFEQAADVWLPLFSPADPS